MDEQYTTAELISVAGVSEPAFRQWCRKGRLILSSGANPGTGNKRRHDFSDVLQCAVAAALSPMGIPPNQALLIWQFNICPNLHRPDLAVIMWPTADGKDLSVNTVLAKGPWPPVPVVFAVLRFLPIFERVRAGLDALRSV